MLAEEAIRGFIDTDYPKVVAAVTIVSGSRAAAEDSVQEALARAWERSRRGEEIVSLPAWVARVALNLSKSRLRRVRAERRATERIGNSAEASSAPPEERIDVVRAISRLPTRQREATVLRYYLDLSISEIAQAMRVSEGSVKTTLFRARATLADALGEGTTLEEATDHGDR